MADFPVEHCRVVASGASGDDAYVLLNTGSVARPYLYGVTCIRTDGLWFENSSANSGGWSQMGPDPELGTIALWEMALHQAVAVRIVYGDGDADQVEVPVIHGVYLFLRWRVECDQLWHRVAAVKRGGTWIDI